MKNYNLKSGLAPVQSPLTNEFMNVGRSRHDLSRMLFMKGIIGLLMPFDIIPAFPNTDVKVGYDCMFECTNPLKKKIFNGLTAYIHTFKVLFNDTWEGFSTHVQHGQDGDIVLNAPRLATIHRFDVTDKTVTPNKLYQIFADSRSLYSPSAYMGLGARKFDKSITSGRQNKLNNNMSFQALSQTSTGGYSTSSFVSSKLGDSVDVVEYPDDFPINALYFVGFLQIFKSKYLNHNLLTKNKSFFPDNVNHFILPYDSGNKFVHKIDYTSSGSASNEAVSSYVLKSDSDIDGEEFIERLFSPDSELCVPENESIFLDSGNPSVSWLNTPRFRQLKGDYFTASSPFANLMRGSAPQINIEDLIGSINWDNVINASGTVDVDTFVLASNSSDEDKRFLYSSVYNSTSVVDSSHTQNLKSILERAIVNVSGRIPLSLQQFREVTAYSIMLERNSKTDGTYNSIVRAQFGVSPKHNQHEPFYVGGANYDIYSTEVIQNSESSASSPLGSQAGRISGGGSAYIGSTHFEDFGFLMSVMSIVPDNIYTQGVDKFLTDYLTDDVYFPLLNNLSADAIKNFELFVNSVSTTNEDIFSWKQRYDQFRSRRNRALNDFVLSHNLDDDSASRIMAKRFNGTPQFNNGFVTLSPKNVDMEVFSNVFEAPFDISIGCRCDWVGPLPSQSNPATFGMLNI